MKHYGDITQINGYEPSVVDIITGGSPCQDLSVAGKRAGLAGERSGLFMEQIRIIKEMRDKSAGMGTNDIRPRYMVWENVPGAFSSNKGEDFRAVLEETARIADKTASIPRPESGRWSTSGCIMADGWSIAWRVHDAQFWGVPQRRKRIALVADFGGQSAPEILFERESVSRDIEPSHKERKITAGAVEKSLDETDNCRTERNRHREGNFEPIAFHLTQTPVNGDIAPCLSEGNSDNGQCMCGVFHPTYCIQGNCIDRSDTAGCNGKGYSEDVSYTLNTIDRPAVVQAAGFDANMGAKAGNIGYSLEQSPTRNAGKQMTVVIEGDCHGARGRKEREFVYDARGNGNGSIDPTITGDHQNRVTDYTAIVLNDQGGTQMSVTKDVTATLRAQEHGHPPITVQDVKCYGIDRAAYNQGANAKYDFSIEEEKIATHIAKGPGAVCQSVVRRLTPLECERLQGYPDNWTDIGDWTDSKGKLHKSEQNDSARYKALGNSIALPFWQWVAERICKQYERKPTMASLFDGIGGFPLVFSRAGAMPIWASEIEEFPIAVTKIHFPESEVNNNE